MLREIYESKKHLEDRLEKPVNLFCYPNGEFSDQAINEVKRHYNGAVTTEPGINNKSFADNYKLQRFGVHQDVSFNRRKLLAKLLRIRERKTHFQR